MNGRVFFTNDEGETFVLRSGPEFELLHVNRLNEKVFATPALVGGCWYFRRRSICSPSETPGNDRTPKSSQPPTPMVVRRNGCSGLPRIEGSRWGTAHRDCRYWPRGWHSTRVVLSRQDISRYVDRTSAKVIHDRYHRSICADPFTFVS